MNLGGQFLDLRHDPTLFRQWRKRDFVSENVGRSNGGVVRRTLRFNLVAECQRADEVVEKSSIKFGIVDFKQKLVTANDGTVKGSRDNTETSDLGVYFGNKKFTGMADLLRFGFNESTRDFIAKEDALSMKLNAGSLVDCKIINRDELFALPQHLPQSNLRPHFAHGSLLLMRLMRTRVRRSFSAGLLSAMRRVMATRAVSAMRLVPSG